MKRTLILITPIILLAACLKKSTSSQHTYFCNKNDSLYSNIPKLANPHYKIDTGYYNQYSDAQIKFLVKNNTKTDTLYFKNDTLEQEYWTITCSLVEY